MTTLTKTQCEDIAHKIVEHRYKKDEDALKAEGKVLGDAFYDALYSKKERELMESMDTKFFPHNDHVTLDPGPGRSNVHIWFSKQMPYAHYHQYAIQLKDLEPKVKEAADNVFKHKERKDALKKQRTEHYQKVLNTLRQYTTFAKLRVAWPEIISFLPPEPPKGGMLAVVPPSLNKELGLPPTTEKPKATQVVRKAPAKKAAKKVARKRA